MASSLDDDFPIIDDDKPKTKPAPVVGAPVHGISVPVPAIGKTWHPDTQSWETLKSSDRVGAPSIESDPSLDEDFPLVADTSHPTPSFEELNKAAEPTGDQGAFVAGLQGFVYDPPVVGKYLGEFTDWAARKKMMLLNGITDAEARKINDKERDATFAGHPTARTVGGVLGTVNDLTAAATLLPEAFGVGATTYGSGMTAGGLSSAGIKVYDDWLRGKPFDPAGAAVTGVIGAGGGALATYLNKAFSAAVDPLVEDLARWGVSKDIPVQAGWIANNPIIKKVPGELYAAGEKVLPATAKSKAAEQAALDAWHKTIPETIGSDAPRLTAKVMADARAAVVDEAKRIAAAKAANGGVIRPEDVPIARKLIEQDRNIHILEDVMKKNPNGKFTPQEFYDIVQKGIDRLAKTPAEEFAYGGGGELGKAAQFGGMFLKTASSPEVDQHLGVALIKKALWSVATGAAPAALHHLLGGEMTPAGILGSVVGGVTALGKFAASHLVGAASRSPAVARELLREGPQAGIPDAANAVNAAALVRKATPGLVQQTIPLGGDLLQPMIKPSQQP